MLGKYDINEDGISNASEIASIAHDLGYKEIMPSENLIIDFDLLIIHISKETKIILLK